MYTNDVKDVIELANIIAERPCDSKDCAPCIRMGRRCNDYLKAERAIEAGYRKQSEVQHQIRCNIGDKIYEVTGEPGERIDIDEYTVSEVGLNGVFTRGGFPCYRPHRHYFAYADEGAWWFFSKEDAEAEKKRRDDP